MKTFNVWVLIVIFGLFFFFQAEDGIRDIGVTGVQTCALPIFTLAMDASMAGELRTLRLQRYLVDRHRAAWRRVVGEQWRAETIGSAVSAAALADRKSVV